MKRNSRPIRRTMNTVNNIDRRNNCFGIIIRNEVRKKNGRLYKIYRLLNKGMTIGQFNHFHLIPAAALGSFHSAGITIIPGFVMPENNFGNLSHTVMGVYDHPAADSDVNRSQEYDKDFFHADPAKIIEIFKRGKC